MIHGQSSRETVGEKFFIEDSSSGFGKRWTDRCVSSGGGDWSGWLGYKSRHCRMPLQDAVLSDSSFILGGGIRSAAEYRWLSARLHYLQCSSTGDTAVLCYPIDICSAISPSNITDCAFNIKIMFPDAVISILNIRQPHIDGLVQERCNSSVLAMELCLSCINPSILMA